MNYSIDTYIIKDGVIVLETDKEKFWLWLSTFKNTIFADTYTINNGTGVTVSTIFTPCVVSYEKPYFETMVFGGPLTGKQVRCTGSLEQAEAMHQQVCKEVLNG